MRRDHVFLSARQHKQGPENEAKRLLHFCVVYPGMRYISGSRVTFQAVSQPQNTHATMVEMMRNAHCVREGMNVKV